MSIDMRSVRDTDVNKANSVKAKARGTHGQGLIVQGQGLTFQGPWSRIKSRPWPWPWKYEALALALKSKSFALASPAKAICHFFSENKPQSRRKLPYLAYITYTREVVLG